MAEDMERPVTMEWHMPVRGAPAHKKHTGKFRFTIRGDIKDVAVFGAACTASRAISFVIAERERIEKLNPPGKETGSG